MQKHSTNMTSAAFGWDVEEPPRPPARTPKPVLPPGQLPAAVEAALWHGNELGSPVVSTCSSGWSALDAELPGAGWGCHSLTEVLTAQPSVLEWRLLTPALAPIAKAGQTVVIVGPPKRPHIPGLVQAGLDDRRLVWIDVEMPAERLWVTEQLVRANAAGAILSWLPHARPEQIRRLQVASQACAGPVFLLRPENARNEASAAPLRVLARLDVDWALNVQILKRRGPRPRRAAVAAVCTPGARGHPDAEAAQAQCSHRSSRGACQCCGQHYSFRAPPTPRLRLLTLSRVSPCGLCVSHLESPSWKTPS